MLTLTSAKELYDTTKNAKAELDRKNLEKAIVFFDGQIESMIKNGYSTALFPCKTITDQNISSTAIEKYYLSQGFKTSSNRTGDLTISGWTT